MYVTQVRQSQPFITVGMLHLGGSTSPELTLKAYHSRVFLAFLTVTLEDVYRSRPGDTELMLCLGVTSALAQWHLYLEKCPRYLTESQSSEFLRLSGKFLKVYKTLAIRHAQAGDLLYPMKPKLHAYQELNVQMARERYNARYLHAFRDEDSIGQTKAIVRCVHKDLLELRTLCRP